MPHEMFADAVVRPISPRARRRRRLLTLCSIGLHVVVIVPIATVQMLGPGPLPTPRQSVIFQLPDVVHLIDIPRPSPPRPQSSAPATEAANPDAAPVVAPQGFAPEPEQPARPTAAYDSVVGVPPGFNPNALIGVIPHLDAPPPAPEPQRPIRPFSGMQTPRKIVDVQPVYPPIAVAARKEGIVILEAIIDARGNVESVRALRSDPLLEPAAVDAVKQWKYSPGVLNGVAVPVIMTVTVNFRLQ